MDRLSAEHRRLTPVDLRQLDTSLRNDVVYMTSLKVRPSVIVSLGILRIYSRRQNSYTERCISTLRRISTLNDDLVQLPPALSSLQASFRAKTSFSHIQRLHNMLYAYGATIVEIVRRKEFCELLAFVISTLTS